MYFLKKWWPFVGVVCEPLQNLIPNIRMVPGITAAPKDVFSRLGFTFLSATQGVNFAISPLFFVKAEKQRERDK